MLDGKPWHRDDLDKYQYVDSILFSYPEAAVVSQKYVEPISFLIREAIETGVFDAAYAHEVPGLTTNPYEATVDEESTKQKSLEFRQFYGPFFLSAGVVVFSIFLHATTNEVRYELEHHKSKSGSHFAPVQQPHHRQGDSTKRDAGHNDDDIQLVTLADRGGARDI